MSCTRSDVDDPRNTDNAWVETTAYHFHCNNELGNMLKLKAGDDAGEAMWLDMDLTEPRYIRARDLAPPRCLRANSPLLQTMIHHVP